VAGDDLCMVKLLVGPGSSGPKTAPSTSAGIGIEVWLPAPARWNRRIHALGGGGWQGGPASSPLLIASPAAASVAALEGAVSSTTDTGHTAPSGAFAMNPDGSINTTLWQDFASRAIHEQALKTKALARAYYGVAAKYSYWEGGSTGGRQGLNLAENHPGDFDGIIANYPAIHWTRFITAELYPQIVFQRDLNGAPLSTAQMDLASNAAIGACDLVGGQHLGYIPDPSTCSYDPELDQGVLCVSDGGGNKSADCLTRVQAKAINKIWFGMTRDGSVPSPAADNGWREAALPQLPASGRWFGLTRGTSLWARSYSAFLVGLASPKAAFPVATDVVALALQDAAIADPLFKNAKGDGRSQWKQLSYAQLADAFDKGVALQPSFGFVNSENADLSAFKKRGGKMLTWHGLADELIMPQGTINYYNRVAAGMGGIDAVQSFYRLYLPAGLGHGMPNGTSNPEASPPDFAPGQFYEALVNWVEKGAAPDELVLRSTKDGIARTRPVCVYPKKATYRAGDPNIASSYECS
jgi:feruloyl esterase